MAPKFAVEEVQLRRRIRGRLYELSSAKQRILEGALTQQLFTQGFFSEFPELCAGLSSRQVDRALANIRSACRYVRAHTFSQVLHLRYDQWLDAYRMGPTAMAFLLDMVVAFGFEIRGAPAPPGQNKSASQSGQEIAAALKE